MISGDIGSAYLNSYTKEKIWTSLGPEFGENDGRARVIKSLYGLIVSAHAWYELFTSGIGILVSDLAKLCRVCGIN